MRIRFKLLILLLSIALIPLLAVQLSVREDITELGGTLAEQSEDTLVRKAGSGLERIAKDHARILRRERQLLEAASILLASKIEGVLYGHSHTAPNPDFSPPEDTIPYLEDYVLRLGNDSTVPLEVNFRELGVFTPNAVTSESNATKALESLVPLLGRIKFDYPNLVLWVRVHLENGATVMYPGLEAAPDRAPGMGMGGMMHGGRMGGMMHGGMADGMMSEEMLDRMRSGLHGMRSRTPLGPPVGQELQTRLAWSQPGPDELTKRMSFRITAPIRDTMGKTMGNLSIVVPIDSLLGRRHKADMYSGDSEALLVRPDGEDDQAPDKLKILARETSTREQRQGNWMVPEGKKSLSRPGNESFAAVLERIRKGETGMTHIAGDEHDTLWAFSPVDDTGTSLLLIVPRADVVRDATQAREFVLAQVHEHTQEMGIIILVVAGLVIGVAMILSRLYTRNLIELASAVRSVALGNFNTRATVRSTDEIGQLSHAFNQMVPELRERVAIKNALEVAQQVQQDLLPAAPPESDVYDVAADSAYCDETGGDYYGFIIRGAEGERILAAVGDVTGHGIPAALMMASVRAYLRSCAAADQPLDEIMRSVNQLVSEDVDGTGRFMTLFLLEFDQNRRVSWVRAGHDPALLFDPATDSFEELGGDGLPLGVTEDADFELRSRELEEGMVILVGTDGIWETKSPGEEMYGKERLMTLMRENAGASAVNVLAAIFEDLHDFRGDAPQDDDVTCAVFRVGFSDQAEPPTPEEMNY
jgi:sigma-B regulation protein RsbU (phosphoserine phosphatase)